jgi:CRISPR-associated protein Csb2
MTTTVAFSFPWGLYHATPWGHDVNEAVVEWPPSPWRLLRALYATWRWRSPEVESSTVERLLGALAAPPAYLLPPSAEAHTRHYMPMPDERDRRAKVLDAFMVFERDAAALVRWPGQLDPEALSALAVLVGGLSYLGRAESICEARLVQDAAALESLDQEGWLEPSDQSRPSETAEPMAPDIRLLAPRLPLDLAALTVRTTAVRAGGHTIPQGARWVTYQRPLPAEPQSLPRKAFHRRPTAVRWAFASPARPSIRAAVAMGDVLWQACLSKFGRRFSGNVSPVLAGKDASGAPLIDHRHAHYLAVDSDGDRLIDHLVVWAPGGLSLGAG